MKSGEQVRKALSLYLLALTALTLIAAAVVLVRSRLLHEPYPYNWLLFRPEVRFSDFTNYYARFRHFRTADFFAPDRFLFNYLAAGAIAWAFFMKLFAHPLVAYLGMVIAWAAISAGFGAREFGRNFTPPLRLPVILALVIGMAYPLVFLLDRGNPEGAVWLLVSAGLFCFIRRCYHSAALLIAMAAAIKIFPAIFLLLFFRRESWRQGIFGAAALFLIDTTSAWGLGIGYIRAQESIFRGLRDYQEMYIYSYRGLEIGFTHGAFSIVQQWIHWTSGDHAAVSLKPAAAWYGVAMVALFVVLYVSRIRKLPIINQILALTAASLVLPFSSPDYRLVHLYTPFIIYLAYLRKDICAERHAISFSALCGILLPFAVLFTPQSYVLYRCVGFGGQIKAVALLGLLIMSVRTPFPSSMFGEIPSVAVLSDAV